MLINYIYKIFQCVPISSLDTLKGVGRYWALESIINQETVFLFLGEDRKTGY